jgi:hypothetical protein
MNDDFRVPLGASDAAATLAEQLQFTLDEGPCLHAVRQRQLVAIDTDRLRSEWPLYAEEVLSRTPYRAIMSLPMALTADTFAALDLFMVDSTGIDQISVVSALTITEEIVRALTSEAASQLEPSVSSDTPGPAWLDSPTTIARQRVWLAIGMLALRFGLDAPDALAVLRSYSYSEGTPVDEVAADLISGTLELNALRP